MKVLFLFAGVLALALTASVNVQKPWSHQYQSEKYDYAYMQKAILQLFKNVYQPSYYPELAEVGSTYSFETNSQFYTIPKYVFEFLEHYNFGYLPKGQVFSIFYDQHQKEAIAFFRVLYSAVDFDTFYKTAAWGRMHLNEGLYIYALSVALVHRPDTWQLELPPIYEMYPFYFYNAEALQKAHQYFFKGDYTSYFKPAGQQMPYFSGKSQYPEQYYQKYGSFPYQKGSESYQKSYPWQFPGQYPYQQSGSYQKSYPYTYGQFPYQKSQYPGQYEQYQYQPSGSYQKSNYHSYPYTYEEYPYEKSQYPGQYEQYQYQQYPYFKNESFSKSVSISWNYQSFPSTYEQYPYKQFQYPTEGEEYPYYSSEYPSQYKSYPYYKSQYPYGKYEQTYPYGKTQYPYGKTPFFYEQDQFPNGKTPFSYEKYSYEKFPTGKSQYPYQYYKQERENVPEFFNKDNFEGITIDYEYNTENPLFYFTEDIGMNAFYYYYHIYFPFWMTNEEIIYKTEFRGEQYYYFYQQLLARYNLERLSNGLSEIPLLDWDGFISYGFETQLSYPNGYSFPQRPEFAPITPRWEVSMPVYDNDTFSLTNIKNYEYRLLEAIDSGFVWTRDGKYFSIFEPQGFEVLGNLIQANPESPNARYYGSIQVFARYVLGYSKYPVDQYNIAPSVLEHFETSLRDPAFYQLYKKVIYYFQRYKQYLPKYTPDELYMPGVKIEDVTFDKLVTYFDYFYSDISSALLGPIEESQLKDTPIRVKQYRLNHQPFSYYLNVNSEKPYEAVIRVFLGPKYDQYGKPYTINNNRLNFVEFDRFTYSLVPGVNTIERNSRESFFAPDRTSYRELYMQVLNVESSPMYETTPKQVSWAMPQRMLLPKGSKEGQTFQMYFIITPYMGVPQGMATKYSEYTPTLFWDNKWDKLPYGYPFDRPIEEAYFFVPNSYFKDVVIYNEGFGKY